MARLRLFRLNRFKDVTGISGTGVVAEGVQFSDGTCVIRWLEVEEGSPAHLAGVKPTTVIFDSLESVEAVHGHGGTTKVAWASQ